MLQATDYNYPLLAWATQWPQVAIIYEHQDVVSLMKYNITLTKG
ncbi:MAG: hypothetical protein R2788_13160 [Saprospiraceae bacterium]